MTHYQRDRKKEGREHARNWLKETAIDEIVYVAASDLQYRETLNHLIDDGYSVPPSNDADFSWGFFKQVKGYVFNTIWSDRKARGAAANGSGER